MLHGEGVAGEQAIDLAAPELGVASMRAPDELARLLGWGTWRQYAAAAGRLVIDARHGNDLRVGGLQTRAFRRSQTAAASTSTRR